jgi:hypothetical protein
VIAVTEINRATAPSSAQRQENAKLEKVLHHLIENEKAPANASPAFLKPPSLDDHKAAS